MPCNAGEELLAQAWKKVLGLKEISTNANFFSIGGDSIVNLSRFARRLTLPVIT